MSPLGTKLLNARALVCPEELAKADMRPFRRDSAFDPSLMAPLSLGRRRRIAMSSARLRSASAPSGSSMPPLRSHRIHLTEILPRPQRYTIWLCGEATVLMAAVALRPACLACQTLMRTLTPKWIKSFGG